MATSLTSTGITFPDATTQTTAASASSYVGDRGQVFTTSGTFTVPTGVTAVKVTVVGGGGGGGGSTSNFTSGVGGGGGGVATKFITGLTPGGTVSVTVGAGGTASTGAGVTGGTSSFGAYCSATGGSGGSANQQPYAVPLTQSNGGVGSGGDINSYGSKGYIGLYANICGQNFTRGGSGGAAAGTDVITRLDALIRSNSVFGYGGWGDLSLNNSAGVSGSGYGSGGGSGMRTSASVSGAAGTAGVVIVEW